MPLSSAAVALLREARDHRSLCEARSRGRHFDLVFPSARGRMLSSSALSTMLRQLHVGVAAFGFRHSFRAWAADTGVEPCIARACLFHEVMRRSIGLHVRPDFYRGRVSVMEYWGRHVAPGRSVGGGVADASLAMDLPVPLESAPEMPAAG